MPAKQVPTDACQPATDRVAISRRSAPGSPVIAILTSVGVVAIAITITIAITSTITITCGKGWAAPSPGMWVFAEGGNAGRVAGWVGPDRRMFVMWDTRSPPSFSQKRGGR